MAEFTKGPWRRSDTIFPAVEDAEGKRVGMFHVNTRTTAEMEANARLCALAPTLLEHMREAVEDCETCRGLRCVACARCATFSLDIAQATGGSS